MVTKPLRSRDRLEGRLGFDAVPAQGIHPLTRVPTVESHDHPRRMEAVIVKAARGRLSVAGICLPAFYKVVLPRATTGIAATAIFCLIFAWSEYGIAVLLTSGTAQTLPPFIPSIIGVGGQDWPAVAAGAMLVLLPVMVFTILLRKRLLRGITFGAVRK